MTGATQAVETTYFLCGTQPGEPLGGPGAVESLKDWLAGVRRAVLGR